MDTDYLKNKLLRTLSDHLLEQVTEVRSIASDLKRSRDGNEVTLTRLEAHAVRLEIYQAAIFELSKGKIEHAATQNAT